MAITKEILDELLKDYQKPEDLLGQSGLLQQLSKALIERVLDGEMTHHLGYEKNSPEGKNPGNSRNGKSRKTLKGKQGEILIEVPRDRNGEFDPQFVKKRQTRFDGFKERKAVAATLKPTYTAATAEQAEQELTEFEAQWGSRYPMIGRSWRNNWARVIPFFQFPEEIRRVIYTTNAVE